MRIYAYMHASLHRIFKSPCLPACLSDLCGGCLSSCHDHPAILNDNNVICLLPFEVRMFLLAVMFSKCYVFVNKPHVVRYEQSSFSSICMHL